MSRAIRSSSSHDLWSFVEPSAFEPGTVRRTAITAVINSSDYRLKLFFSREVKGAAGEDWSRSKTQSKLVCRVVMKIGVRLRRGESLLRQLFSGRQAA